MTGHVHEIITKLGELLDSTAAHRARVAEIQAAWDIWYDEGHDIHAGHGFGPEAQRYRTVQENDLPEPATHFQNPEELNRDYITALHRLRDIRSCRAIPALLKGATTARTHVHEPFDAVAATPTA
jgi:hypothetical protein